jgi:hypothetical protein
MTSPVPRPPQLRGSMMSTPVSANATPSRLTTQAGIVCGSPTKRDERPDFCGRQMNDKQQQQNQHSKGSSSPVVGRDVSRFDYEFQVLFVNVCHIYLKFTSIYW